MTRVMNPAGRSVRRAALAAALALSGWLPAGLSPAQAAAAHCMARIVLDVAAEEAPEQIKSKSNGEFGPITQVKVRRTTGRMLYCAKDSYCYGSNAFELVTPCRLKLDKDGSDGTFFSYFTR